MTREEGLGAWARGIAPNTVRAILMNMSQLARYDRPLLTSITVPLHKDRVGASETFDGADPVSYDWIKAEMIKTKIMEDGPGLHFVASLGAVCHFSTLHLYLCGRWSVES